jgi:hypothetical protein
MLKGYRTYILGAVTVIGAVAAYLVGDVGLTETVNLVIGAAMAMFIRSGVTTEVAKLK